MEKLIIYQVFTRLFGANANKNVSHGTKKENGCGKMADFTGAALAEIKKLGATHIWYTGLIEHATKSDYTQYGIQRDHPAVVKGIAGSPYAIKDYYDIDPDLATKVPERMKEFENLIMRTHKAELKMIIDFVPNHVARQYHSDAKPEGVRDLGEDDDTTMSFSPYNNFYYMPGTQFSPNFSLHDDELGDYVESPAKVTGNDCFTPWVGQNDWYETVKLNYGVDYQGCNQLIFCPSTPSTWIKMRDILLFWASKGIDGFRCDMAEMVPCDFWGWVIPQVKAKYPDIIFIAEVYNPHEYRNYLYRGRFDYLYDKVGLYDTIRSVVGGNTATSITGAWQSVDDIHSHMPNFLENHDEQRIASKFFAGNAEKGKPALLVSALMNTNPMMVYFGQELGEQGMYSEGFSGQDGRTTIFDYWSLSQPSQQEESPLTACYRQVLTIARREKAVSQGTFFDLMYVNPHLRRQYAFLRSCQNNPSKRQKNSLLLVVANFDDVPVTVSVCIPAHAFSYLGIRAGDCEATDLLSGNIRSLTLQPDHSVSVTLAPRGAVVLSV